MKILITGAAGYIGSHICVELLNRDDQVVLIDNLSNSKIDSLNKVSDITNKELTIADHNSKFLQYRKKDMVFIEGDIRDSGLLNSVFSSFSISAVIHLAGYKSVSDSLFNPLNYYDNNLITTIKLLREMKKAKISNFIFSSSASVYGSSEVLPIKEDFHTNGGTSPYGQTKFFIEKILGDIQFADPTWNITILRYFNPVGAHSTGLIGEDLKSNPSNLMPFICQVAAGKIKKLQIFGNDYPTNDGTGIRDYIHVVDLAKGHLAAMDYLKNAKPDLYIFNLGTGRGTSVLELVQTFEEVTGRSIPYEFSAKRIGDIAESWTSTDLAEKKLGWVSKYDLKQMCKDAWRWQVNND